MPITFNADAVDVQLTEQVQARLWTPAAYAESGLFCASSAATYSTSYHRLGGGFGCISRLVSEPVSRMNAGSFKRTCISNSFVLSRPESASLTKHRVVLITGRHCARPPPWGRAESFAVGLLKGLRGRQPYCQRWQ